MLTPLVEEKYGNASSYAGPRKDTELVKGETDSGDSSTDSEEEDDDGILASEPLDAQIQSTLEAIRRKDPRVYDKKSVFYTDPNEETNYEPSDRIKKEKPLYLSDYHRKNLLEGVTADNHTETETVSYAQQQDDLQKAVVMEVRTAANAEDDGKDDVDSADDFLIRKASTLQDETLHKQAAQKHQELDVEAAEKDPETYLSNFMSARAWVSHEGFKSQAFESDDEDEERRAELFEESYNFRFEDPSISNEKLLSHARDAAAKYSVRKEATNPRKRARDAERAKKELARQSREEEKARLRKLKVTEAEHKLKRIKEAAGLRGETLQQEDWAAFLEEGWDDARWDQEMEKRFGEDYYADKDLDANDDQEGRKGHKIKKPKWEDDIDIGDLVPGFNEKEDGKPQFDLTDDESDTGGVSISNAVSAGLDSEDSTGEPTSNNKAKTKQQKDARKKSARQDRRKVERLVDQQMEVDETLSRFSKKHAGLFRYRETSPLAYGLTAHDILMASDSQLNQYAGLKKMAAFRDPDKKRKDKKHLGKKARLRQWRKDTFGREQGPEKTLAEAFAGQDLANRGAARKATKDADIAKGSNKTRSKKSKSRVSEG